MSSGIFARLVAVAITSILYVGCSTLNVDQAVYSHKKIAIVAYYGPKSPDMSSVGTIGTIQGVSSSWTTKILAETSPEMLAKLNRAGGVTFSMDNRPSAARSYASLPKVMGDSQYVNYSTLKPVKIGGDVEADMGKLAKELKVDGVMIMSHYWLIDRDKDSSRPYATDIFEVAIYNTEGKKVWKQKESVESAHAELSGGGFGTALVGAITEKDAQSTTREATLKAVDKFVTAWNDNKK